MARLELRNLTRRFGDFVAVDDVSLSIESGEFFTLLGPSGCGKTTILRMIAGFDQADLDAQQAQRGFRIRASIPKEGAVLALDSMVLHKSGPRPDLAHRFIDFMLQGRNSAELTNLIGSGNPNRAARQYIQPEIAQSPAVFPDKAQQARLEMLRDLDRHQRRVLSRIWTEIKLR